jgi:hypothetical protein
LTEGKIMQTQEKPNSNKAPLRIIAGPDSLEESNLEECYQIANLKINNKPAIYGWAQVPHSF